MTVIDTQWAVFTSPLHYRESRSFGTGASAATQWIIVGLAVLWQAGRHLITRLFADAGPGPGLAWPRARLRRLLSRLFDALLWILGAAWLGETWGLDLVHPAPGSIERLFVPRWQRQRGGQRSQSPHLSAAPPLSLRRGHSLSVGLDFRHRPRPAPGS